MKKLVLGAVAASMVVLGAPIAHAAQVVEGGCGFSANDNAATQGFEGEIDVLIVAFEDSTTPPTASDIDGACWIEVDGVEAAGTRLTFSGSGVVADAQQIAFENGTTQLCWDYTLNNDPGPDTHVEGCVDPDVDAEFPPQEVIDLLDAIFLLLDPVFQLIEDITTIPDFILCPILASLSPGIPGVVDIDPDGDVHIPPLGEVWLCPPYDS